MADAGHDENELLEDEEMPVDVEGCGPRLKHVETTSGEEQYDELLKLKAKIWRFDEGENRWKERGQGDAKILQRKDNNSVLFIFRREAIGKIAATHFLMRGMKLHAKDDKSFVWVSPKDYTDDPVGYPEQFYIKFASKDLAEEFKAMFEKYTQ